MITRTGNAGKIVVGVASKKISGSIFMKPRVKKISSVPTTRLNSTTQLVVGRGRGLQKPISPVRGIYSG